MATLRRVAMGSWWLTALGADIWRIELVTGGCRTSPRKKIVPDWKEMMKKRLEKLNKTADLDAELADPSYICRRCFGLFERYRRQQDTLLANLQHALAHDCLYPSYICRKCFGLFEWYRRQQDTLLANLQCALAHDCPSQCAYSEGQSCITRFAGRVTNSETNTSCSSTKAEMACCCSSISWK